MAKCVIKTGKHGFSDDLSLLKIFAIKSSEKSSSFSNNCCSLRNEIIFRLLLVKLLKLINILSTTLLIFPMTGYRVIWCLFRRKNIYYDGFVPFTELKRGKVALAPIPSNSRNDFRRFLLIEIQQACFLF